MDLKMLELVHESQKEQMKNRTVETQDNKEFLAMVSHMMKILK